jgi:hypothetical protein
MAGPAVSVGALVVSFGDGFQPIGQKGLRLVSSIVKEDLCFSSRTGALSGDAVVRAVELASAAQTRCSAATVKMNVQASFFIAS